MTNVASILTSVAGVLVAIGAFVVLLRVGVLVDALSTALGGKPGVETPNPEPSKSETIKN